MDMLIGGKHITCDDLEEVKNPFNDEVIDTVPIAHLQHAKMAIKAANNAKKDLVEMSAFKVSNKLYTICEKLKEKLISLSMSLTAAPVALLIYRSRVFISTPLFAALSIW